MRKVVFVLATLLLVVWVIVLTTSAVMGETTFLVSKNGAVSNLRSPLTASPDNILIYVTVGEGDHFPSTFPYHVTIGGTEIVEVTGRATDDLTAIRGQEGASIVTHNTGETVRLNVTAEYITELQDAVQAAETNAASLQDQINDLVFGGGYTNPLVVGVNDTTSGSYYAYGGSGTTGGALRLYNGGAAATGGDYFSISADGDMQNGTDLGFRFKNGSDEQILSLHKIDDVTRVYVGEDDVTQGYMCFFGNSTTCGGKLSIYNSVNENTNASYYAIEATGDTVSIGKVGKQLTISYLGDVVIPGTITATNIGTMAAQAASAVAITGGAISGATISSPSLGTMSTQAASAVAITGGTMANVAITGGTITGLLETTSNFYFSPADMQPSLNEDVNNALVTIWYPGGGPAGTLSGWKLTATYNGGASVSLSAKIGANWPGGTANATLVVYWACPTSETNGDDGNLRLNSYYNAPGDSVVKMQQEDVSTNTNGTQWKVWSTTFTIDGDLADNVIEAGDIWNGVISQTNTNTIPAVVIIGAELSY
jgi:hypothetical protein